MALEEKGMTLGKKGMALGKRGMALRHAKRGWGKHYVSIKFEDLRYFSWNLQPQKIQLLSFLIFESIFNSRMQRKNLKSQIIYEHYFNYTFWPPLLAMLVNEKLK